MLSLLISLLPVLRNIGPICGQENTCHSGYYGHFVDIGHYGLTQYGVKHGRHAKCRSVVNPELKICICLQVIAKTLLTKKLWPFPFCFYQNLTKQRLFIGVSLSIGVHGSSFYFWNQGTKANGKTPGWNETNFLGRDRDREIRLIKIHYETETEKKWMLIF